MPGVGGRAGARSRYGTILSMPAASFSTLHGDRPAERVQGACAKGAAALTTGATRAQGSRGAEAPHDQAHDDDQVPYAGTALFYVGDKKRCRSSVERPEFGGYGLASGEGRLVE